MGIALALWGGVPATVGGPLGGTGAAVAEAAEPPAPYVRLSATASVAARPDVADLYVTVQRAARTRVAAARALASGHAAVIRTLRRAGVASADVRTNGTTIGRRRNARSKVVTWVAWESLEVRVRTVRTVGVTIARLRAAGAAVGGPNFRREDVEAPYRLALEMAIDRARTRAEAVAARIGVRLGAVISVEDVPSFGYYQTGVGGSGGAGAGAVPVAIGTVTVSAAVVVTYAYER
jgi:hypothetical protein